MQESGIMERAISIRRLLANIRRKTSHKKTYIETEDGHFSIIRLLSETILPTEKQAETIAPAFAKQR
jgi:hypothetical protein